MTTSVTPPGAFAQHRTSPAAQAALPKGSKSIGRLLGVGAARAAGPSLAVTYLSLVVLIPIVGMLAKSIRTGARRPTRRSRRIALSTAPKGLPKVGDAPTTGETT